nr:protein rolling stone [Hymenolepis microstoma]CDS35369.1 protein rolling stone [Hymenolepis microstoma]
MSMNTVVVTSLAYWAAFFDPTYTRFYRLESEFKHSIPALTVVLDVCINGLPIRLFHAIYPIIFGILYSSFAYLYYDAVNVQPIYTVLDWSDLAKTTVVCLLIITVVLVVQVGLKAPS